MTGFYDLPNEIVLELWHHVLLPGDIASFARVSKQIYALAERFLKEHHRLESKYSVLEINRSYDGSVLAHLLKDVLLKPYIAFYVKKLHVCDWYTCWEDPIFGLIDGLDPDLDDVESNVWHLPYPEQDMELFRNCIRKAEYLLPSEVDFWIQLLESGDEDPILTSFLSLLPNLCTLSLEDHPVQTMLFTTICRMTKNTASTSFSKLRSVHLSDCFFDQREVIFRVKPFVLLPSVEKISCRNLDNRHRGRGIPDCLIAPQSSNVTELVFESCGDISKRISVLLEGIKGLKKFTYVAVTETVDAFWIRSALLNHCRHSLEYLKMGFGYGKPNYIGSLRLFKNLKTLDVEHGLLVDPDDLGNFNTADLLPTSIEAVDMTGTCSRITSHIHPFIKSLMSSKRTRLPNLKRLSYHFIDIFNSREYIHAEFADMCYLCEENGVVLTFE
ncbi:MAG: hypothetical protein ASARMPREDX12_005531 [Alectoria sarmentosa]|nr:MAG: hypothetical protein ASARMPREDX12_005531 [Alectoria sarmentosa]